MSQLAACLVGDKLSVLFRIFGLSLAMALEQVTVALDWTPNTNHVGFYAAQALGMYSEQGLAVKFVSPHSDNYKITPASRVAAREASN